MSSSVRKPPRRRDADGAISSSIRDLPGIGKKREELLQSLGIRAVGDLLIYAPSRYVDRSSFARIAELHLGETQTVEASVSRFELRPTGRKRLSIVHVEDASGKMRCVWFNQPYLKNTFLPGVTFIFSGTVRSDGHGLTMVHPEYEAADSELVHTGRIVPFYRTRPGLSQKQLRAIVKHAVDACSDGVEDLVPAKVRQRLGLTDLRSAIRNIHFPSDLARAEEARRRLAFDEMLAFQTLFVLARSEKPRLRSVGKAAEDLIERFTARLPFQLTASQRAALNEISLNLAAAFPMRRLLQGDVGSGKTVVASLAAALVSSTGGQVALLCPTEILAEQHFETMKRYLTPLGISVWLLTGSTESDERERIEQALARGEASLAVGTHALIGKRVKFGALRLVIVDEEQRFGVLQRNKLVKETPEAHLLVVSATPIPRSLAMTAYGDLDVTVIDQMPPGRGRHTTLLVEETARSQTLRAVAGRINVGLQGYYVCPALDEGSGMLANVRAARAEIQPLVAPGRGVAILTGRTPREERARILESFRANRIGLLVATTVIEVGMDIPSATLLIVDQAERFGLSQLHQMRGRVQRTDAPSFSYLMVSEEAPEKARARLKVLESTFDGFEIAERDLAFRGPGELGGTRQHGIPDLRFASLPEDLDLMGRARAEALKCVLGAETPLEWQPWLREIRSLADGNVSIV